MIQVASVVLHAASQDTKLSYHREK